MNAIDKIGNQGTAWNLRCFSVVEESRADFVEEQEGETDESKIELADQVECPNLAWCPAFSAPCRNLLPNARIKHFLTQPNRLRCDLD